VTDQTTQTTQTAGNDGQQTQTQQTQQQTQTQTAAPFDWATQGLDPVTLNVVNERQWKAPADVVKSYVNLEKLAGLPADQLLRLPKGDDPALWGPVWERLGAGKTADDYKLPVPDGQDGAFAKTAAGWFKEHGVPVKAAQAMTTKWNAHMADMVKAQQAQVQQRDAAQLAELKNEWGANEQANTVLVDRAAATFGMSSEEVLALRQVMGAGRAMKFLHGIGSRIGIDDKFISDNERNSTFNGMSPAQAIERIAALRKDLDWTTRYAKGDTEARRESDRLHRIAYPS